jgi:hypothetical protein
VVLTAKSLMEIFGETCVYRMNGTQFVAFGFESEELFFNNDFERAKKLLADNGIQAVCASVYCANGTRDMNVVMKRAEELIYKQLGKTE